MKQGRLGDTEEKEEGSAKRLEGSAGGRLQETGRTHIILAIQCFCASVSSMVGQEQSRAHITEALSVLNGGTHIKPLQ